MSTLSKLQGVLKMSTLLGKLKVKSFIPRNYKTVQLPTSTATTAMSTTSTFCCQISTPNRF